MYVGVSASDKQKKKHKMVRKRLFLGGLYHEVDATSLSDRFAAYGQISNVDIKTKCDSEGVPFKVMTPKMIFF